MTHYFCAVCFEPIEGQDIDNRHSTPDGDDCHEACCPECNKPTYRITHLAGSCRSGSDNTGHVTHAVTGQTALCGTRPGPHSAGWSEYTDRELTCPKCKKKVEATNG
jgi:hypothetical protein